MKINEMKSLFREDALSLSDIQRLPESRWLDTIKVTGACVDVILRMHDAMHRLAPMGNDERRSLWFEVKGKKWEWYQISTTEYKDRHYLHIDGGPHEKYVFCDKDDANTDKNHWYDEGHQTAILSTIANYVENLIAHIEADPEAYNTYVDKCLSPYQREGLIKRSILNTLIPNDDFSGIDIPKVISIYESRAIPTKFPEMTLRTYMHFWRIAYESIRGKMTGSDIDVFRHSSKGHEIKNYDIDSETDFLKWSEDVSSYHGFDVVYARVGLHVERDNGHWHFRFGTGSYWNLNECLKGVIGLTEAGLNLDLGETEEILGILKETDYVEITPYAYRYMQGDGVGSQMRLPYPGENISKETIKQIIANTEWKKLEKVHIG